METPKERMPEKAKPDIKQAIRSLQDAAWNCGTDEYRDGVSDNAVNQRYSKMVQARSDCVNAADALLERVRQLEEALSRISITPHSYCSHAHTALMALLKGEQPK